MQHNAAGQHGVMVKREKEPHRIISCLAEVTHLPQIGTMVGMTLSGLLRCAGHL